MALETKTGTLAEAEQSLAEAEQKYHAYQADVTRLARELRGLDTEPETWTPALVSEREASKRNLTKASSEARAQLMSLQRHAETQKANVQRLQARTKELPGLIERLRHDLTREGRYGGEIYRAEQTLLIVQNQHKQQQQALARLENELQALAGE